MRALLITFEFGNHISGGLGRVVNGLIGELRLKMEFDVYLLYFNPARLGMSAKLYRCDREHPGKLIAAFTWGSVLRNCIDLVRREKYDVLHFFNVHSITYRLMKYFATNLPRQPIVYSIHSLFKYEANTRRNPDSFLAFEWEMLDNATLVHVLNQTTRDYFEHAYSELAARKPVRVIANGIEPRDFLIQDKSFHRKLSRRLCSETYTVACMSRWAHGKGLEYYIEAAERLLAAGHDMQFVLAGRKYISWEKHWYSYLAKIQHMAWRLGSRFVVLDWLNAAERNTLFGMADSFVMPSELEYYPYSVLEPVAAGLPLICSSLPCVRELLIDQKEFLSFRSGDSSDLARQIAYLASAPEHAEQMARHAQFKVEKMCAWPLIAGQYLQMYQETISLSTSTYSTGEG